MWIFLDGIFVGVLLICIFGKTPEKSAREDAEKYERFRQAIKKSGKGQGHVIITATGTKDSGIGQGRTINI